ncbi:MAG: hypothetical protein Q9M14_03070 [Mariprofundaceae bacterium]|nr:hypothetical protein [Mariprofundaceae bacterium]
MHIFQSVRVLFIVISLPLILLANVSYASEDTSAQIKAFNELEIHADAIVNTLLAKDLQHSRQHYNQLLKQIKKISALNSTGPYHEQLSRQLMMAYSWLRIINNEVTRKSWVEAAIGANQLRGMLIQASHYPTLIQRDLKWLDYLGKEIELLSMEDPKSNADLLMLRKATMENTWHRVRKELIKNFKNKPIVIQGDALIVGIDASNDIATTINKTNRWLIFIHGIDKKYNNH